MLLSRQYSRRAHLYVTLVFIIKGCLTLFISKNKGDSTNKEYLHYSYNSFSLTTQYFSIWWLVRLHDTSNVYKWSIYSISSPFCCHTSYVCYVSLPVFGSFTTHSTQLAARVKTFQKCLNFLFQQGHYYLRCVQHFSTFFLFSVSAFVYSVHLNQSI